MCDESEAIDQPLDETVGEVTQEELASFENFAQVSTRHSSSSKDSAMSDPISVDVTDGADDSHHSSKKDIADDAKAENKWAEDCLATSSVDKALYGSRIERLIVDIFMMVVVWLPFVKQQNHKSTGISKPYQTV